MEKRRQQEIRLTVQFSWISLSMLTTPVIANLIPVQTACSVAQNQ